jgi:hypothetical protein
VIIFDTVQFLPIKNNQTEKKTKTGLNRPVSGRFFMPKTEKTYMQIFDAQFPHPLLPSRLLVCHFLLTQLQYGPWIV